MTDKIIFKRDRLTVSEANLTVGRVTAFYSSISALSIYDGRPLLASALQSALGLIPLTFMFLVGRRIFGPYFPIKIVGLLYIPFLLLLVAGILYRIKCLFVTIDGHAIAVLKSKDVAVLEQAKAMIEQAKTNSENRNR